MIIYDKEVKIKIDVLDEHCIKRSCYWPRPDPGLFTQGRGYTSRAPKNYWICGTREIRGCPDFKVKGQS